MPITDLLERNHKLYGGETALVEINPRNFSPSQCTESMIPHFCFPSKPSLTAERSNMTSHPQNFHPARRL